MNTSKHGSFYDKGNSKLAEKDNKYLDSGW